MDTEEPRGKGRRDLEGADTVDAIEHLSTVDGSAAAARASAAPEDHGAFEEGTRIGRFIVAGKLGEGGMGVVLLAQDPELRRRVAIKILRPDRWMREGASEGRQRLLREAQAMAQVSHPNVIPVYEVGTIDGEVFVAMEHVEGSTLKEWLGQREREVCEILDVFLQAGRGLAASHIAGLVHRDFKPDNVLVGDDGRVRVTDFGLVGTSGESLGSETQELEGAISPASLGNTLTRTGMLLGTPIYMAPEQHRGDRVDARADQFAFCVALYEALYGERPFPGTSYEQLVANVLSGNRRQPRAAKIIPVAVGQVLSRGLESEPDARYSSMTALLGGLEQARVNRAPSRRRIGMALAVTVLAAAAVATVVVSSRIARPGRDQVIGQLAPDASVGPDAAWPAGRSEAQAMLRQADALKSRMQWDEARRLYKQVAAGRYLRARGLLGLARVAFETKDTDGAVEYATKALAAGGGDAARMQLGHAHFKQGRYREALNFYDQVLKHDPGNKEAQASANLARSKLGSSTVDGPARASARDRKR